MTPTERDLERAAARYHEAATLLEHDRAHLMQLAQEAAAEGLSEYRIATLCLVQRSTVRRWLGK